MRATLAIAALALAAGCSTPAPEPAPAPDPAPEPVSGIETAAVEPATESAVPLEPETAPGPADVALPDDALPPSLAYSQIEKTFAHHRRFFDAAYRERLGANPKLSGTIWVGFTVHPDGTIEGARLVKSSLGDPVFDRTVLDAIAGMHFPPATGPTPVERYPLYFSPPNNR